MPCAISPTPDNSVPNAVSGKPVLASPNNATAMNIDNVKVLAYSEVKTYSRGRHEENYVFDDILVSICLANGLPMPKAITICTREKGFTKEEIANMSNEEFKQNEESIMHQIREGLI